MAQTKRPFTILLVDSEESDLPSLKKELSEETSFPTRLDFSLSFSDALEHLSRNYYHVIIANSAFREGEDVSSILKEIHRRKIATPLLLMVSPGEESLARQALKLGATDYVVKTGPVFKNLAQRLWGIHRNYELSFPEALENEISSQNRKLVEINEKLRALSIRDELTGLYNHRHLQERLVEEFTRAVRYGHPLSCLLLDLDLFRNLNEQLGYGVGDTLLKEASEILIQSSRLSDLIARFGGEEFVILLPHVDYEGAAEVAERLRGMFASHTFLPDSHQISMTVSIGLSCFPEDPVKDRSDLLNFADQALFRSKAAGRNQVTLYRNLLPSIKETLPHLKISEERILEFQRKLSDIADKARRGYMESSRAMIMALESKDRFTAGHAGSVARLATQVAEACGLSLDEAEVVGHAGLLHDIGKICISDEILLKPKQLTLAEYEAMKQHPYFGYRILKPIKFLREEAALILHHHEWFNGQGYPCQLAGNEIPLGARIVSVVDSYDTMRHAGGRYKATMPVQAAVNELIACAGTQFDPEVVQAFIQVLVMRKELDADSYDKSRLRESLTRNPTT